MADEIVRVRCAARPEPMRILERRLSWWTERLVDSSEPLKWHLTATIDGTVEDGIEATCRALQARHRPRTIQIRWELLVDSPDGGQVGAFVTGRLKRTPIRRARLIVSGTDPAFASRLAEELSHSRWQLHVVHTPGRPAQHGLRLLPRGRLEGGHPSLRRAQISPVAEPLVVQEPADDRPGQRPPGHRGPGPWTWRRTPMSAR
ncbi:MAG: hypothetical protein R2715_20160 [Ilumatobacteraceae bacterium]